MELQERIELMVKLGQYMSQQSEEWIAAKKKASWENAWFAPEFIELSIKNIYTQFLQKDLLANWLNNYDATAFKQKNIKVGLVMAGNIPLVGFHDFLCVFLSGKKVVIKSSSRDEILIKHLVKKITEWDESAKEIVAFEEILRNCDAYIATGSNNSSRYFDYYFGKYPHIIRRNRTSVAILDGNETKEELDALADDIQLYFGLGCRNITKLYVPEQYDFIKLLDALRKYDHYFEFHKYKHNYDYHLALLIMGNKYYMNNGSVIFTENTSLFSPVSQVNYEFYTDRKAVNFEVENSRDIQCIVGNGHTPFGTTQQPTLSDYADGVDTMKFLTTI